MIGFDKNFLRSMLDCQEEGPAKFPLYNFQKIQYFGLHIFKNLPLIWYNQDFANIPQATNKLQGLLGSYRCN